MLRGGVIVVTAIFSVVFLKKKLTLTQIVGCSLTIIGIGIVGLSNLVFPERSNGSESSVIKSSCILLSQPSNWLQCSWSSYPYSQMASYLSQKKNYFQCTTCTHSKWSELKVAGAYSCICYCSRYLHSSNAPKHWKIIVSCMTITSFLKDQMLIFMRSYTMVI